MKPHIRIMPASLYMPRQWLCATVVAGGYGDSIAEAWANWQQHQTWYEQSLQLVPQ